MRALYDHFLTMDLGDTLGVRFGFLWYPGSLSTSLFPSYGDLPRFSILGMSGSSSSLITTLVPYLVSLLSSTSLSIFFYPHRSSSRFMNDVSFGVHHLLLGIVHYVLVESLCSHDCPAFGIAHTWV